MHITQLLLAEAVVIGVLAVATEGLPVMARAGAVAAVVLAGTLGRRRGRWWLEYCAMRVGLDCRGRGRPEDDDDPRLVALRWLAPALRVEPVDGTDGARIGVGRDEAGWYAVAVVAADGHTAERCAAGVPVDAIMAELIEEDQPGTMLQVVTHSAPAPSVALDPSRPARQSYLDLVRRCGPVPIPADRLTWAVVRLDARTLAESGADDVDAAQQAPMVAAALIRKVAKSLRTAGFSMEILDRNGLLDALVRSCDLEPTDVAGGRPLPREGWDAWHSGRLAHRAFWVQEWPPLAQARRLLDSLASTPCAQSSLSIIMTAGPRGVDVRCIARIASAPADLDRATAGITRVAQRAQAKLLQLDGEHGPAVYASAPTGGGPR